MTIREAGKGIVTAEEALTGSDLSIPMDRMMRQNLTPTIWLIWKHYSGIFVKRTVSGRIPLSMWNGK